jgi:hypothetical protein
MTVDPSQGAIYRASKANPKGAHDVRYVKQQCKTMLAIALQRKPLNFDLISMLQVVIDNLETIATRLYSTPTWLQ